MWNNQIDTHFWKRFKMQKKVLSAKCVHSHYYIENKKRFSWSQTDISRGERELGVYSTVNTWNNLIKIKIVYYVYQTISYSEQYSFVEQ